MKKFLCVCDGGNVRSHALAFHLKWDRKQEAIAAGRLHLSVETMSMLCEWADVIVLMEPHMVSSIPTMQMHKIVVMDVGPDRWGVYVHPELWKAVTEGTEALGLVAQ